MAPQHSISVSRKSVFLMVAKQSLTHDRENGGNAWRLYVSIRPFRIILAYLFLPDSCWIDHGLHFRYIDARTLSTKSSMKAKAWSRGLQYNEIRRWTKWAHEDVGTVHAGFGGNIWVCHHTIR